MAVISVSKPNATLYVTLCSVPFVLLNKVFFLTKVSIDISGIEPSLNIYTFSNAKIKIESKPSEDIGELAP